MCYYVFRVCVSLSLTRGIVQAPFVRLSLAWLTIVVGCYYYYHSEPKYKGCLNQILMYKRSLCFGQSVTVVLQVHPRFSESPHSRLKLYTIRSIYHPNTGFNTNCALNVA